MTQPNTIGVPKVSRGLRSLPITSTASTTSSKEEYVQLKREAAEIEQWWSNKKRWDHTKRVYSALDVACLRPSAEARGDRLKSPKATYASQSSDKLYSLLSALRKVGGYSHTFGALDPVQVIQMAPHLSSIYVSGWQCSSTASTTNEPGPDFADYPYVVIVNVCCPDKCKKLPIQLWDYFHFHCHYQCRHFFTRCWLSNLLCLSSYTAWTLSQTRSTI